MFYEILTDSFNGIRINTGDNFHRLNEFHQGIFSCLLPSLSLQPVADRKASNIRKDPWRGAGDKDERERGGRVGPLDAVRGRVLQQFSSLIRR